LTKALASSISATSCPSSQNHALTSSLVEAWLSFPFQIQSQFEELVGKFHFSDQHDVHEESYYENQSVPAGHIAVMVQYF
jgi:hypothetical protein